jgi:hypothetical protein
MKSLTAVLVLRNCLGKKDSSAAETEREPVKILKSAEPFSATSANRAYDIVPLPAF